MSRQALLMRELGLAPQWRLRAPFAANLEPDEAAVASAHAALPVPASVVVSDAPALVAAAPQEAAPLSEPPAVVALPAEPAAMPAWDVLQQQVQQCQRCTLCRTRTQTVFGKGNPRARVMLVGEAPGAEEDRQGQPFVGKAGQLLDNMLAAIGLSPDDVYIANVLKCRPPGNRNPAADEIAACGDYLRWQIAHVQPQVLVTLGRFAAHALLHSDAAIGVLRKGTHQYQGIPLFATFHPAYLLRSPGEKAKAWQDLLAIRRALTSAAGTGR